MNPSREEELFQAALELPAAGRNAFLDRECAGDPALRARLDALLTAHEQPDDLPPTQASPAERRTVKLAGKSETPDETLGQTIGRYKVLEKLGEGGFGIVYVAEQKEPVRRRVALKIIKLGMDTREVVARFEAERQALAMMEHPNIAKVLDGGATDSGRPFFVMELVPGIAITKYCDEHHLPPHARLALFSRVCLAIQHAHQKGIIHRDIKPSNILVIEQDGVPVPKVIDFGIAKATQGDLTDKTVYTQLRDFIGTPAYMSPEQVGGPSGDIDTRSDIYSLGVLLYELLTGKTPFDAKTLLSAGLEEMRRIIRDVDPPAPSTRLSTLGGEELRAVALARHVDPRRLGVLVRGDLDWIVMKALEKDRARRYATAYALADDIRRFLHHEPVSAVAPSATYKLRKFVRRNRAAVTMALSALLLLIAGVVVSSWFAVVATRAREVAALEARKSAQVARFLQEMLDAVRPAKALGRDTVMLRELLDLTSDRIGRDLQGQPEVEFELRGTIGRTYEALGALEPAEASQRAALAISRRLYGNSHTNTARLLEDLGFTLGGRSQFAEATNVLQESLAIFRSTVGDDDPATAGPLHRLGSLYSIAGRFAEAEPLLTRALDIRRRRLPPDHRDSLAAALDLATLYYQQGRLSLMESLTTNALDGLRRTAGPNHPTTLNAMSLLAVLRQTQGRFDEAEQLHTQLLEVKRRILGPDHFVTLISMDNLALVYGFQGRYGEAEDLCRRALNAFEPKAGTENRDTLAMRSNLAEYLRNLERYAESEALFKQVIDVQRRTMTPEDPFRQETQNSLAVQYHLQGRETEAEALLQDLLQLRRGNLPADDPSLADTLAELTLVLLARDRTTDAERLARECWSIHAARPARDWRSYVAQSQLGACQLALLHFAEAEPLLTEGFEGLKAREQQIPVIERRHVRESIESLVRLADATNQTEKAAAWRRELDQFKAREAALRRKAAP